MTNDWAKLFFVQPNGQRCINVHARQPPRPNQRYALLFRDYLVAHPRSAAAYGELKQRLAGSLDNEDAYADVKDPAVNLIYFAAEEWASNSRWQAYPGTAMRPDPVFKRTRTAGADLCTPHASSAPPFAAQVQR
jgi:hypothetical protein